MKEIHFVKEDLKTYGDDDFRILCGFSDLYHASPYGFECLEQLKTQELISIEMSKNQLLTDATVVAL